MATDVLTERKGIAESDVAGRYLTFALGEEAYGLEILKVQEIIGLLKVTSVPRTPDFVRGVVNLRGRVIPVIELRRKFGMEMKEDTERTCIIVVQIDGVQQQVTLGIIVDEVSEVLDIAEEQIEPPPSFGASVDTNFMLGMAKTEDKVVMLLDIGKVLSDKEVAVLDQAGEPA